MHDVANIVISVTGLDTEMELLEHIVIQNFTQMVPDLRRVILDQKIIHTQIQGGYVYEMVNDISFNFNISDKSMEIITILKQGEPVKLVQPNSQCKTQLLITFGSPASQRAMLNLDSHVTVSLSYITRPFINTIEYLSFVQCNFSQEDIPWL